MISRRLIRIKISHILYAYFKSSEPSINKFEKELFFSLDKTYELYHYFLLLIVEVKKYALSRIDLAKNKRIPNFEDLNPNLNFVENKIISQIEDNVSFKSFYDEKKISWVNYPELIKELYNNMIISDWYKNYTVNQPSNYSTDKKFIIGFYQEFLENSELLYQILEEKSIYWNDEIEFVINMVIKTIKDFKFEKGTLCTLLPLFKNDDDKQFAKNLFRKTVLNSTEYLKLIEDHTKNWDIERIAFIDILIMQMAIAEVIEFPSIPIKVTLNEYIEIIKYYSTTKSSTFINGILDKVINTLQKENKIHKTGRGLITGSK